MLGRSHHRESSDTGRSDAMLPTHGGVALLELSREDAQFIDAAVERILPGESLAPGAALYLDRKLWEFTLDGGTRSGLASRYRAGIAAVQTHCVCTYGRRFEQLQPRTQDAVLALLEEGDGIGDIAEHRVLASLLVIDAAEAYFAARHPTEVAGSRWIA
jgi:Gluconate 2-dehydrogenase subunit 3